MKHLKTNILNFVAEHKSHSATILNLYNTLFSNNDIVPHITHDLSNNPCLVFETSNYAMLFYLFNNENPKPYFINESINMENITDINNENFDYYTHNNQTLVWLKIEYLKFENE